jgi:hypothetical protein
MFEIFNKMCIKYIMCISLNTEQVFDVQECREWKTVE